MPTNGLKDFIGTLTLQEQRAIAEGLTEGELAIFDILTKPEPVLTKAEEPEVKKVCRELLATLKREKLALDWREKLQAKAGVMQALKGEMRRLPPACTKEVRAENFARAYAHAHVHDHFGNSVSRWLWAPFRSSNTVKKGAPKWAPQNSHAYHG